MKGKSAIKATWPALFAVLVLAVSVLASASFDWDEHFPVDEWVDMAVVFSRDYEGDTVKTIVHVERGPLVAGSFDVVPSVHTKSTQSTLGTLLRMRFLIGDDVDSDGKVAASEWLLVSSAEAAMSDGWMVAQTSSVTVAANKDRYRIEYDWSEPDGYEWTLYEEVGVRGIDSENSNWALGPPPD